MNPPGALLAGQHGRPGVLDPVRGAFRALPGRTEGRCDAWSDE